MADEFQRQLLQRHDFIAHEIGDRVFGGRDQVQVAVLDLEQVALELGEAGDAVGAGAAHQVGHVGLGIAVLGRVHVEHELGERTVQARDTAFHHRKARTRKLRRGVEIQAAERHLVVRCDNRVNLRLAFIPQDSNSSFR